MSICIMHLFDCVTESETMAAVSREGPAHAAGLTPTAHVEVERRINFPDQEGTRAIDGTRTDG